MSWYETELPTNDDGVVRGADSAVGNDKASSRRQFRVTGHSPDVMLRRGGLGPSSILNDASQGMPDYGSQHPVRNDLYLVRYATVSIDVLVFDATAEYEPYFPERSGGFQSENYELPIATRSEKKLPGVDGNPNGTTMVGWEFSTQAVLQTHERMVVKVRIDASDWGSQLALIRNQQNRLQKIRGVWYRFEMPDYVQIGTDMMEVTYNFFGDTGITQALTNEDPGGGTQQVFVPLNNQEDAELYAGVLFVRPPFNTLVLMPVPAVEAPAVPADPPVVSVRGLEVSRPLNNPIGEGWRSLPGIPQDL